MENFIQIFTSVGTKKDAQKIALELVNKNTSACVQIVGPVISFYKWKGKLEKSKEWLCMIKTERKKYKEIENIIKQNHPYELPEIIALPIVEGSKEYLRWLK